MVLTKNNGGNGNNYTNTVLRTDASTIISGGGVPFTGTFRPEGTLTTAPDRTGAVGGGNYNLVIPASALNGAPIDGAWSLRVFDNTSGDPTVLVNWSISIIKTSKYTT